MAAIELAAPTIEPPATDPPASTLRPLGDRDHLVAVGHKRDVPVADSPPVDANEAANHQVVHARLADALLLIFSDALNDFEQTRIATENRIRSLRDVKGLAGSPEEARLQATVDALHVLEHQAELDLARALRQHPLGPWVKRTAGVGEKQGARLIAAIGDPYWNYAEDRPRRGPAELWAYCGYHVLHPGHSGYATQSPAAGVDPSHAADHQIPGNQPICVGGVAPRPMRGQRGNWSATAKMRAFLVAESCMKHRASPYRAIYDDGRAKYAEAVHPHSCVRCGPKGKPAPPGSPLSDGHKHARALRLVAKAVLRDLWVEAKRLHEAAQ